MKLGVIRLLVLGSLVGGLLSAGSIGPTCGTCYGSIYTLDAVQTGSDAAANTETWQFSYSVDTTGYSGPWWGKWLASLAVKVSSSMLSFSTLSTPTAGAWWSLPGGANNFGCTGSGSGWMCLQYLGGEMATVGGVYAWDFSVTMTSGSLLDMASIKANYDPSWGALTSERISTAETLSISSVSVPEGPAAELPLFTVFAATFLWWRKKHTAS